MPQLSKAVLLIALLGLAACQNPDRYGSGAGGAGGAGTGGAGGSGGAGGIGTSALGDPSNPASPAYFQASVGDRVFFLVDQFTLTDAARQTLVAQAAWLQANPGYGILIEGHADEQGTREYNLALGAKRANAVKDFLVVQGIPASRLRTVSYGKERPVEVCSDEACYAKNRRAVTVLSAGTGA